MSSHREELAWAAGFFDGEGSTHTGARRYPTIAVTIKQIDRQVLDRFRDVVGIGAIYGPYRSHQAGRRRPFWTYQAAGFEKAQAVLAMLWPWPGSIKRGQAVRWLSVTRVRRPGHPVGRRFSATKLTTASVLAILASRENHTRTAARFGVTRPMVSKIRRGLSWRCVPRETAGT